ncbi:unnamed protein product [Caenorhabditis nigoni]
MNVVGFLFRTGHNVEHAFEMLKREFSAITIAEVQDAFLALKLEGIPFPINNSDDARACLLGIDAPTKDKILRMLPGKDLKNMRLVCRGFNDFINAMDLVVNKVLIHLNPTSVQLVISKIGMTDMINVSEAQNGSVVEINGETTPSEVLFVEQGVKELEKVVERRNKKVEQMCIQFESEVGEEENVHDAHRNEFFGRLGETLSRLNPRLMCNALHIKIRTPLDLLPIIGNISPENFTDLVVSSNSDGFFEMRDVLELQQWRQLRYLRFDVSSSLSLADITHIPDAVVSIPSPNAEQIMPFVEACLESPNELSYTIMSMTGIAHVAQQLKPLGMQRTIGGTILGRIPLRSGGYIKYEISRFVWNWETVSLQFENM